METEQLSGSIGNGGNVFRKGDILLRPQGEHSAALTALLQALATTKFPAPVPLGATSESVEAFSWIDGDVAVPSFPQWSMTDEALSSAGRLLRSYHATVSDLSLPPGLRWSDEVADPQGGPIICHNDVCPENVVFRDGDAVALLDFDLAAPGRPIWDLAQMARMWAPLRPPELVVEGMAHLDPFHRLGILARAYELNATDQDELIEAILESRRIGDRFVRRRLAARDPAFVQAWEPLGGEKALDHILSWLIAHQDAMLAALS